MKLKQLDIVGFKSFVEKTTVRFPQGICAVVGPNGCGKSNIVDALRWVMGEQSVKQLRGKSMEDIIFSGSEKKAPVNMAEVALTLVNDNGTTPEEYRHYSEIMVSRRLFRSGESGYFINKQPCRLKDVQNLLMGSGVGSKAYAVIEQGKIGNLIDAGPEERRYFIEEAAGVTRYKSRKHEALLKIQRTQHNLLRINDVIIEVKRQMNSLKRQAGKAERYKIYQKQIEGLEITVATHEYKAITAKMDETKALLQSLQDTDFEHESELAKLDAAIEEIKQHRTSKYQSISEQKTQKNDLQRLLDKLEGSIEHKTKDINRFDNEVGQFKTEVEEIEEKRDEISQECNNLEERKTELQQNIGNAKENLTQQVDIEKRLRSKLDELKRFLEEKKSRRIDLASRKATYQNTLENASQNRKSLSKRLEQLKTEKKQAAAKFNKLDETVTTAKSDHRKIEEDLGKIGNTLGSLENRLLENRHALSKQVRKTQETELERQKVRSQYGALKKMDENYEWFKKGVRVLMNEWKSENLKEANICGLVADIIEPETSYEDAVEAALAETLQYVIVENQQGAVTAIDSLHTLSGGRASLVPLNAVKPLANTSHSQNFRAQDSQDHSSLINHIKIREGYEDLVRSLLGHVKVVRDLELAIELWNKNGKTQTIVTQQGDRICFQGILTGGRLDNGAGGILTKKKELRQLHSQIVQLDRSVETAKARKKELETEAVSLERDVQQTRQRQKEENQQLIEKEKELFRLQENLKHTRQHLEILNLEEEQIDGERVDVEQEVSKHQKVLAELQEEIRSEESSIEQTDGNIERISKDQESLNHKVVELKMQSTSLQAEYDSCENTLRRLTTFQQDSDKRLSQLHQNLKQTEQDKVATKQQLATDKAKIGELYAQLETLEQSLTEGETQYQAIEGRLQQNDQALSELKSKQQETFKKTQQLELKQSERKMRRNHLASRILEKYNKHIEEPEQGSEAVKLSVEEIQSRLTEYRDKIFKIGEVNLTAIEQYETLKERYSLLTSQRDDLDDAIEALHLVIRKINRVSLKRFMKTFKAVNEKVQAVFPKLFEGGTAKLSLTNPKRPLDSGVSFLVRPPGKKLTRMSLLSGGEKALSSIALIFSLFLIRPTAFCILDEIDAPLDDVNVFRFNQLLREIGSQSQVVMITHDRQTMEVANALFGVTMEEKGISKLVSLDFQ
ncbi:MAG: chromosome segregation protein SMC [Desulfobacterales bacterium S7086C20]|nr:MAG: chromosome segregation protein SMC [Desulfobacterales bacterium S7086C20]